MKAWKTAVNLKCQDFKALLYRSLEIKDCQSKYYLMAIRLISGL